MYLKIINKTVYIRNDKVSSNGWIFKNDNILNKEILNNSIVGKDFLDLMFAKINIDLWLEYRFEIMKMKEIGKYPYQLYDNELKAIDHIIDFLKIINYVDKNN